MIGTVINGPNEANPDTPNESFSASLLPLT